MRHVQPVPSRMIKKPAAAKPSREADPSVRKTVDSIIADIRERGDAALRQHSQALDNWNPPQFRLSEDEIDKIVASVPAQVISDIEFAQDQVRRMATRQMESIGDFEIETLPGVRLGQRNLPVDSVASYVPGGRFPLLASAHMTIVTAKVAGVPRVLGLTPPIRGEIPAATVATMRLAGADEIYLAGGVQAVAAAALGTESIAPVDMIAGPGNSYVAEAKRQLFGEVGIDLLAGPTEIVIIADDSVDAFTVAVDLLSQAEHGPDSPAILITPSERLAQAVDHEVRRLLPGLPTNDLAGPAWRDHGAIHVVDNLDAAWALSDFYAGEHVEVLTEEPRQALEALRNYGALFLGEGTCVSYGDKVIGTNHVLPTRGGSRYTGGLWVGKYLRTTTYQEVTDPASIALLGEVCGRAARTEGFEGHARAADIRAARHGTFSYDWDREVSANPA